MSYKHRDSGVQPLSYVGVSTARDYVDRLEEIFAGDHIYKGERGDEDLGAFKDDTIQSHLRDRIFDSSITLVLISKNMKEPGVGEKISGYRGRFRTHYEKKYETGVSVCQTRC